MDRRTFFACGATLLGMSLADLVIGMPTLYAAPRQQQWGWLKCKKCSGLFFGANENNGVCPVGGEHVRTEEREYALDYSSIQGGQPGWRWCGKCQGMWFAENRTRSVCAAGGTHTVDYSYTYSIIQNDPKAVGQSGWKWCRKCQGMFLNEDRCPAGGQHDGNGSGDYIIPWERLSVRPRMAQAYIQPVEGETVGDIVFSFQSLQAYDTYNLHYIITGYRIPTTDIIKPWPSSHGGKRGSGRFRNVQLSREYMLRVQGCMNNGQCSNWSERVVVRTPVPID